MISKSVVIVEDEPLVAVSIAKKLTRMGLDVLGTFESGKDAVPSILKSTPDLVLLDIKLSNGEDGVEVAHQIHKSSDIPIIFLTALADQDTVRRAAQAEPYSYLVKPFSELELRSNIEIVFHRHELENRVKANEKRYRIISELSSDLAYSARIREDGTLMIEWITDAVVAITGYTREELFDGFDFRSTVVPEESRRIETIIDSIRSGDERDMEHQLLRKDGSVHWVRHRIRPEMKNGKIERVYGSIEDISELKRIEEIERAKEQNYKNIIREMNDGVIILDRDNIITYVNKKTCSLTGYSNFEMIGEECETIIHTDDLPFVTATREDSSACHEAHEVRLKQKDGDYFHALISAMQFHDAKGKFSGSFWIITNINRQKAKEQCLEQEREEAAAHYAHIFNVSRTPFLQLDLERFFEQIERDEAYSETDLHSFLMQDRENAFRLFNLISVARANPAALDLFQAESVEELHQALVELFVSDEEHIFLESIAELARGNKHVERKVSLHSDSGSPQEILFDFFVPEYTGGYENILMTINAFH